jgi:hypothetical protein
MTEITWFWELFNWKRWCGIFFLSFHNIHCTKCFGSFCYLILLNRALLSLVCDKAILWFTGSRSPSVRNALDTKVMMWHILSSISQHLLYQMLWFFLLSDLVN